jgi:CheY-like chemotaxis protein
VASVGLPFMAREKAVKVMSTTGKGATVILLVEDDLPLRHMCHEALGLAGFCVEVAANGLEALDKLAGRGYDIVITDMRMPVLGGKEFYQLSVKKYPELRDKFLFMSGDLTAFSTDIPIPEKRRLLKPFKIKEGSLAE